MKRKVMTILCFITGFLLCSYPLVSNRIEQERQQKVITTYENGLEKTKDMESVWREAQKYNEMLQQIHGKIVAGMMEKTLREEHYETLLNVSKTGVMGVIVIPKISVKLPIYHGTEEDVLAVGAGHMEGSALPVAFFGILFGSEAVSAFLEWIPDVVMNGLTVCGGLLPAVGMAMLMKMLWDKKICMFFFLGFICVAYLELPLVALAVLGVIIAVVIGMNDYQMSKLAQMRPVYAGDLKDTELDEEEEEFFNE